MYSKHLTTVDDSWAIQLSAAPHVTPSLSLSDRASVKGVPALAYANISFAFTSKHLWHCDNNQDVQVDI